MQNSSLLGHPFPPSVPPVLSPLQRAQLLGGAQVGLGEPPHAELASPRLPNAIPRVGRWSLLPSFPKTWLLKAAWTFVWRNAEGLGQTDCKLSSAFAAPAWTDVSQPVCTGPWICGQPPRCHELQVATRAGWADASPSTRLPCLLRCSSPRHPTSAAAPRWPRTSSPKPQVSEAAVSHCQPSLLLFHAATARTRRGGRLTVFEYL